MKTEKCRYYNNAQTACTLMIDDLAGVAITQDGRLTPRNDWGYGMDGANSLWRYFERNLMERFPEIKGTVFFATQTYKHQNQRSGYKILSRAIDPEFAEFVNKIIPRFEFAFHGTTHGKYVNENNPELKNNYLQEFEYLTPEDIPALQNEIRRVEELLEIKFVGGKYCGYRKNEYADEIIEKLGFKWWSSSARMINRKHPENRHKYFGDDQKVLDLPTNISGNYFNRRLKAQKAKHPLLRLFKAPFNAFIKERYLQYLYENGLIISVQEHFQNQRTDGKRQTPNVYDDIDSLTHVYGLLRGTDTWYATCSEIAHYLESYDHSEIIKLDEKTFEIKYHGRWGNMFLSVKSDIPLFLHIETGKEIKGIYKNGHWVFNNIPCGKFVPSH